MRGTLFLIVGPSGSGKDTLIDAARRTLAVDPRYVFARRVVTRPAGAGGEDHEPATPDEFAALASSSAFGLCWSAHGVGYGIRRETLAALGESRCVVANVSRQVITTAQRAFAPVKVIEVTAEPEALARRLAARGRESASDIAERLARAVPLPEGLDIRRVDNSGDIETAAAAFLAALAT